MNNSLERLLEAQKFAMANRPKVGGFPFLAEVLRRAGAKRNLWYLPSCQSVYLMEDGSIVQQGAPLVNGSVEIPKFDESALIKALRIDQAGKSTFPEFILASWRAGVVSYDVDFLSRKVTYFGVLGESYVEEYPVAEIKS